VRWLLSRGGTFLRVVDGSIWDGSRGYGAAALQRGRGNKGCYVPSKRGASYLRDKKRRWMRETRVEWRRHWQESVAKGKVIRLGLRRR
jgi:hypothetical protein